MASAAEKPYPEASRKNWLDGDLKERHDAATALSTFLLFTTVNQMQANSPFEKLNKNKTMFLLDLSVSKKTKITFYLDCYSVSHSSILSPFQIKDKVRDLGLSLTKHLVC